MVRLSDKLSTGVGEILGEACLVVRNEPEGDILVVSLEDIETICEAYLHHCMPEDEVYN